ncbi:MAG TPA: hypothetical protein PKY59_21870 [Pyrinomonadaceae bacterium]|nr:hypothetical protein [Pyrinomonadaceae bacterium]
MKLGISTVEDVKAIFGTACDDLCEYDSNWKVLFIYFKNISVQTMRDEKKIKLIAEPESVNKLYSISIIPNNEVSLKDVKFSNEFYKSSESITGHDFSGNSSRISVAVFSDSYGLKYSIFNREDYSTFKEKNTRQNGSLIEIKYTIPNNLEEKMFIEQK